MKIASLLLALILSFSSIAGAADKSDTIPGAPTGKKADAPPKPLPGALMTQADFARELVALFGWGEGLSDVPTDRDYLLILEGRRTFKFEAEKAYSAKTDNVSTRKNAVLGPFSGESWLGGIATPTTVHMKIFIPAAGEYVVTAAAKGDGQKWRLAGKEFTVNSGGSLAVTKIADLSLKAGELEIEMLMPAEGGLDYIMFSAPDFTPVEPQDGWRFKDALTNLAMAQTASSLLALEGELPLDESFKPITVIVSEMKGLPSSVSLTNSPYSGRFSGKQWVRTKAKPAEVEIPFTLSQAGSYGIKVRFKGNAFIGSIDGNPLIRLPGKPALDWVNLGLRRLSAGKHSVKVTIPPYGGIDSLVVEARKSSPEAYMTVTGLSGNPAAQVTYAEMENFLASVKARFKGRK